MVFTDRNLNICEKTGAEEIDTVNNDVGSPLQPPLLFIVSYLHHKNNYDSLFNKSTC